MKKMQKSYDEAKENELISLALKCLETRLRYGSELLNNSSNVRAYLQLQLADEKNEVFGVLFLSNSNRLLAFEKLFYGTINEAVVYPRIIAQKALEHNAAKVILTHNHPSGTSDASQADHEMTRKVQDALSLIEIKTIDHIVVTHKNSYSFAEHGLM